ncbi:hypothetical protein ACLMJK_004365 [Lecanora helva]
MSEILSTGDSKFRDAKVDAEYQVCWSNTMEKGSYKNPSSYQKVEVLLLCWADNSNDLVTKEEVNRLKRVFTEDFHYHTHTEYLDATIEKRLQVQVNAKVAAFVDAHDGRDTLLLVYYAGHGRPGSYYGALEMHGFFEYLGATDAMGGTPVPGADSFTSALIYALKYLVKHQAEGRFTTLDLLGAIKSLAPDFPKDQSPVLCNRIHGGSCGQIMLHPIQPHTSNTKVKSTKNSPLELAKQHSVTLHFDFDHRPSVEQIKSIGLELNSVFDRNVLVNGIRWGGLKPSLFPRAVQTFLEVHQKRASMKRKSESATSEGSEDWSNQTTLEPLTPSSPNQSSPTLHEITVERDSMIEPSYLSPEFSLVQADNVDQDSQGRGKKRRTTTKC